MSIIDNTKGGVNLPKVKDLAKNALNSTDGRDKLKSIAENKPNDLTAPVIDKVNEAKDTLNKAQNIMDGGKLTGSNPTSREINPMGGFTNYSIVSSEELEKQAKLSNLVSYGGDLASLFGDSHLISCSIQINGEDILKESNFQLSITQNTAEHNTFKISCPADAFGEATAYPLSQTGNFLGKRMTAMFRQFGKVASSFSGIITNISSRKEEGFSFITLTGQSPTILLENGFDSQSYEEKNLKDIIGVATSKYSGLLEWDIRPLMEDPLLYTVQYKESDWQFIKRLAIRYGEWLYWDGTKVVFGGYGGKTIELQESKDISRFELKMQLVPQKFTYLSYDAKKAQNYNINSDSVSIEPSVNPFKQTAVKASEEVFAKLPASLYNQSLMEKGEKELQDAVKRQKQNRQNVFYLEADSDNPELRIGDIVKLKAYIPGNEIFKKGDVPLESYRILRISHSYDPSEGYKNTFTAVPKDNFTPPYMNEDALPNCEEQSAVVTDNKDPQKMGRVRVQFPWQKSKGEQTPWIRLVQPHAGGGKGFYFIPETGEEVMTGFENNNAEKPFIIGTQYNGKAISGYYTDGNDNKVIQSRSGTKIVMNDAQGSIFIEDPSGNTYFMDGKGNMSMNAPKNINLTAGEDLNINVGNNMNTTVGNNYKINIEETYSLTSKNYKQVIYEHKTVTIEGDLKETTGTTTHKATQGDILLKSAGVSTLLGAIDAKLNKG